MNRYVSENRGLIFPFHRAEEVRCARDVRGRGLDEVERQSRINARYYWLPLQVSAVAINKVFGTQALRIRRQTY